MAHVANSRVLRDMIDERARQGWTRIRMEERCRAAGMVLTDSDISNFYTKTLPSIKPTKVKALAYALDLPVARVAAAVLLKYGIEIPMHVASPEDAIRYDERLSSATRDMLLAVIRQEHER